MVRAAGMKMVIENDTAWPSGIWSNWPELTAYYATLDWTQYQQARAQTAEETPAALGLLLGFLLLLRGLVAQDEQVAPLAGHQAASAATGSRPSAPRRRETTFEVPSPAIDTP